MSRIAAPSNDSVASAGDVIVALRWVIVVAMFLAGVGVSQAAGPGRRYRPVISKAGANLVFRDVADDDDSDSAPQPDDDDQFAPDAEEPAPLPEADDEATTIQDAEEMESGEEFDAAPSPDDAAPGDDSPEMSDDEQPYLPADEEPATEPYDLPEMLPSVEPVAPGDSEPDSWADGEDDLVPLTGLKLSLVPSGRDFPTNVAARRFAAEGIYPASIITRRNWAPTYFAWQPTGLCYSALYFEEPNLERYGYNCGVFQPFVSTVHFCGTLPILPYLVVAHPQRDCVSTLGIPRAGGDAPLSFVFPKFNAKAAIFEGAVFSAVFIVIP